MRLINANSLELHDFTLETPPPYAILSHTWGRDEVTFRDLAGAGSRPLHKAGYFKILKTCRIARGRGLSYAWIDTCCIDKTSSAELTESINSMFRYYENADICIVHLEDLSPGSEELASCRWFTRGWTLQELLAPRKLVFYDQTWAPATLKHDSISVSDVMSRITKIPASALAKERPISTFSIAERMSWAARRRTTRPEDMAYCLLGIFEVNMPLIYGEGSRAFRRLQEEIVKRHSDLTIFAWEPSRGHHSDGYTGMHLLAESPADFARSSGIEAFVDDFPEFAITNKGLVISPDIPLRVFRFSGDPPRRATGICLGARITDDTSSHLGICLRKISPGLFCRHEGLPLMEFDGLVDDRQTTNSLSFHIVLEPERMGKDRQVAFRRHAIYVPRFEHMGLVHVMPERLWAPEDKAFLRPSALDHTFFPRVLAMAFLTRTQNPRLFIVVCDNRTGRPTLGLVPDSSAGRFEILMCRGSYHEHSISWTELEDHAFDIEWIPDETVAEDKLGHNVVVELAPSAEEEGGVPKVHLEGRSIDRPQSAVSLPALPDNVSNV